VNEDVIQYNASGTDDEAGRSFLCGNIFLCYESGMPTSGPYQTDTVRNRLAMFDHDLVGMKPSG
jgi:hypothetical protein